MKYGLPIILAFILLMNQAAYGQNKTPAASPSASAPAGDEPGATKQPAPAPKKIDKPSDWSFFWQLFRFKNLGESKINFETGLTFYGVSYDTWNFRRFEPFVKLRWALLGKYLTLYTMFSTDFSSVSYELSHFKFKGTDVSFSADMKSSGKHTFGGGVEFLIFGWKKLNLYGYAQTQSTSVSGASLGSAVLTLGDTRLDIFDKVKDYVDITYTFERYDCGAILSYQPLKWLTLRATVGYIWLSADIKLALKPDLNNVLNAVVGTSNNMVPDRLSVSLTSPFGMLGVKFRLYRKLHLNMEGTVLPSSNPVYYGQISFSIE